MEQLKIYLSRSSENAEKPTEINPQQFANRTKSKLQPTLSLPVRFIMPSLTTILVEQNLHAKRKTPNPFASPKISFTFFIKKKLQKLKNESGF